MASSTNENVSKSRYQKNERWYIFSHEWRELPREETETLTWTSVLQGLSSSLLVLHLDASYVSYRFISTIAN